MRLSTKILLALNKLFKAPVHPLNLQDEGVMSYAMWQYKKGAETIRYYLEAYTEDDMFKDKVVLDIGCGAGGKSLYYASRGAKEVIGVDILENTAQSRRRLPKSSGTQSVSALSAPTPLRCPLTRAASIPSS